MLKMEARSESWRQTWDAGYWGLNKGASRLDAGQKKLDTEFWWLTIEPQRLHGG
jgi:hypothetical protein